MNLYRKAELADRHDSDKAIERSIAILLRENARLKRLVVQLSETVIRNVTRKR